MSGFIIDTPEGISAFVLLQIKYKLKLEVENPKGPKWKFSPAQQARQILVRAGKPDPGRLKKNVYTAFLAYLEEIGVGS